MSDSQVVEKCGKDQMMATDDEHVTSTKKHR